MFRKSADKETGRIEAFSDGVFAIAITLLALELKLADGSEAHTNEQLWDAVRAGWPRYMAFLTSFFSILIMWVNHHYIFNCITRTNRQVLFANGFMLFLVTSVNYPTALLAEFYNTDADNAAAGVYSGLFVIISISFNLLWYLATKDKKLLAPGVTEEIIRKMRWSYLIGFPVYVAAFVISFFSSTISLAICTGLWIFWAVAIRVIKPKQQ